MPFNQQGNNDNANIRNYYDILAGNQIDDYGNGVPLREVLQQLGEAGYDCSPWAEEKLQEGTRGEIISTMCDWGPSRKPIRWLNGSAGSGKSTIARSVARVWDSVDRLAGSFCLLRNSGDRSKASRVLPTIAYQLTISIPETKPVIEDALRRDLNLLDRSINQQFQKLIVDPIKALRRDLNDPVLIVIDALDACDDIDLMSQLVAAIASTDFSQFPVRFLFTSRIEEPIRIIFHAPATNAVTREFSLAAINAEKDIRKFLRSQFDFVYHDNRRLMKDISLPWPSSSELTNIVKLVNGSFIFASMLAKFVGSPPPIRLQAIVEAHTGVDGTYTEILTNTPGN